MMLQLEMTAFCTSAIFSGGTSRPKLPRDRMMPSAADAMDLKLNSAGRASSFAMSYAHGTSNELCISSAGATVCGRLLCCLISCPLSPRPQLPDPDSVFAIL